MIKSCKNCINSYVEKWIIGNVYKCHLGLNRLSKYNPHDSIEDVGKICKLWKSKNDRN